MKLQKKKVEAEGQGQIPQILGSLERALASVVVLGTVAFNAFLLDQSLTFKITFAFCLVSVLLFVLCIPWLLRATRERENLNRSEMMRLLGLPMLALLSVFVFGYAASATARKPGPEARKALELQSLLVNSFSGFRIGIIGRMKFRASDSFIPAGSEMRYQLVRINSSGERELYKQVQPSGEAIMFIDNIEPGVYEVRLDFYSLTLDYTVPFQVGRQLMHIVYLSTPGHDVPVLFEVYDSEGKPVKGVWIQVVGPHGQHIRGGKGEALTTGLGRTEEPLWLQPVPGELPQSYIARIRRGEYAVIAEKEFEIAGTKEYYDRQIVHLVVDMEGRE